MAMRTDDQDLEWIRTQLTIARWFLDAAVLEPDPSAVRQHRERARQACDAIVSALSKLDPSTAERGQFQQELAAIQSRLGAT